MISKKHLISSAAAIQATLTSKCTASWLSLKQARPHIAPSRDENLAHRHGHHDPRITTHASSTRRHITGAPCSMAPVMSAQPRFIEE
jgi:hypothetical protein